MKEEIDPRNAHQQHTDRVGFVDDWDESDEDFEDEVYDDSLDPAFSSWEQVNGMFYTL